VKTVNDKVVIGIHWPNHPCKNDWWGTSPCAWKFGYWLTRLQKSDFRSIFASSDSAV